MGKSDVGDVKNTSILVLGTLGDSLQSSSSLRFSPNKNNSCYRLYSQRKLLLREVEQVKLRLLQVNFLLII